MQVGFRRAYRGKNKVVKGEEEVRYIQATTTTASPGKISPDGSIYQADFLFSD